MDKFRLFNISGYCAPSSSPRMVRGSETELGLNYRFVFLLLKFTLECINDILLYKYVFRFLFLFYNEIFFVLLSVTLPGKSLLLSIE